MKQNFILIITLLLIFQSCNQKKDAAKNQGAFTTNNKKSKIIENPTVSVGSIVYQKNHKGLFNQSSSALNLSDKERDAADRKENRENEEDGIIEANALEFMKTQDPALHRIPNERLQAALKQVNEMRTANTQNRTAALTWNERGPNNIGGRTRAILVDKRDLTGNTIFTGSVSGGIWKCTNFTTNTYSWSKVNDNMANLAVTVLAQDPTTLTTMYAGTGEGYGNIDAVRGGGIFKSIDGGTTWNVLAATSPTGTNANDFNYVQDIAVTATGTIYASGRSIFCNGGGGILKSIDGGTTWTRVIGTPGADCPSSINLNGNRIKIAANGDLYATTGLSATGTNNYGRIFKSAFTLAVNQGNAGQWTDITPTPPGGDAGFQRVEIGCAPSNSQYLYAVCQGINSTAVRSLYFSTNGGTSWTQINPPSWCDQGTPTADFTRGQAFYDLYAAIDPNSTNNIYLGGVDIMKSADGGNTFANLTQWAGGNNCGNQPYVHADQHNLTFLPTGATTLSSTNFIVGCDGGIFYTTDGGNTFTAKNNGYNITQYYSVAIHPTNPNYFIGGAQDNGSHKFSTAGINTVTTVSGGDGGFAQIGQIDPSIQISSYTYSTYYISRDGGTTFPQATTGDNLGLFINPMIYDEQAGIIYRSDAAGNLGRVENVKSGTSTLTNVAIAQLGANQISALKNDGNQTNTIWVGTTDGGTVLKIVNPQTATPTVTDRTIPGVTGYISSIDVEKGNSNHLIATISNYGVIKIWESKDGGATWTNIQGNLPDMPVRWGIFLPSGSTEGVIAIATELGVFTTTATNGTNTVWNSNSSGLPNVRTDMLKYRRSDNTMVAATHGRGLFTTTIAINPITWTGTTSNDWNTVTNWSANRVPTATDSVIIPTAGGNMPISLTGGQSVYSLNMQTGTSINSTGTLQIAFAFQNSGSISGTGTTTLNGTVPQTITGTGSVSNFTLNNSNGATISPSSTMLNLTGVLTLTAGTLVTNGNLTLKSTSSGTASIGNSAGTISGNIIAERYFTDRRAWRLLGIRFNSSSQTIKSSWMEGGSSSTSDPNPPYGTHITTFTSDPNAANFDASKPASSIRIYSGDNFNSDAAHTPNTTNLITSNPGYFLFVRGNRSVDLTNSAAHSAATLRVTGIPNTGNVTAGVAGTAFSLIPNPYSSPVDFNSIKAIAANSGITTFYLWDATLGTVGQYRTITISGTAPSYTYTASPGSQDNNWRFIESGAAFMIPGSSQISFTENTKTSSLPSSSLFRTNTSAAGTQPEIAMNLNIVNQDNSTSLADGVREIFDNSYSAAVDNDDAKKIEGFELNFGIVSNNQVLSVEKRPMPSSGDVITLQLSGMAQGNYQFEVEPSNLSPVPQFIYLRDNYLNTYTPVSATGNTTINFTITSDAASAGENRFSLVFTKGAIAPGGSLIEVYPNPVQGGSINLLMNNMPKGLYNVRLINAVGQTLLRTQINHAEGTSTETIRVNNVKGTYMIEVTKPDNSKFTSKIIIN